jgi:quercetin dioxygenase-like cupin family protein
MNHSKFVAVTVAVVFVTCVLVLHAQETRAKRDVLIRQDISGFPGHEGVVVHVEFAPGAREPRHTHPGDIFGYIQEGTLTVGLEGQQAVSFKPGEVFFVPARKVHWGENAGTTTVKVLATFVVEKGKPLTTAAQ